MTCELCSNACTEILKAMPGVLDVECSIEKKEIIVTGQADSAAMFKKLEKWSKENDKGVVKLISA
uniref:AlNc14C564G12155 protein n=1 Tax=Albugo laibachii Nc14 TaxID=890382 RepID=F0X161_9STRA|nr:AlNc14C564G12155 [Albugo laibachii Nc14]|eukprot:CCA27518.1 AlNc14C564G12155 [Albugo laibachii Nc14]